MSDDPKKRLLDEVSRLRDLASSTALGQFRNPDFMKPAFETIMPPPIPYIPGEAEQTIEAIGSEIERWKAETPDGKHLVVMLGTPDGGIMDVETFRFLGRFAYRASGYVNGERNMAVGHVATLAFRGFYEDDFKGTGHAGFQSFIRSQPAPALTESDNT
jgi:hypothetical protein